MGQIQRYARALLGLFLRRPILGTTVIPVLPDGRIVMVRRRDNGCWSLPGGLIDWGEDVLTAAARELAEETGLTVLQVQRLVGVYSHPKRDPRFHSISVAIAFNVTGEFTIHDIHEISEIQAFPSDGLPNEPLSHDHARQLQDYLTGQIGLV